VLRSILGLITINGASAKPALSRGKFAELSLHQYLESDENGMWALV
jgi:hypothetical protein